MRMMRLGTVVVAALVFCMPSPAAAQEWTRFRGPAGQGIGKADDLPTRFTAANVRWRVDAGMGHSSPVLWKNKLFLTRMGEAGGEREIVCFDAEKGEAAAEDIMAETGEQAIQVRRGKGRYVLVAGVNRLEASKALGEATIRAYIVGARLH